MKVWKFDSGYVNIRITGRYPERLVNRCIDNGVRLSNCERSGECINADVRTADFKRLRPLVRGTGLSVRISSRRGADRVRAAVYRNAVFAAALLLASIAVAAASFRLWFIRVETVSIPEDEIIELLGGMGVRPGVPKKRLSPKAIADSLNSDPRIVNAKVVLRGVTLKVTLAETRADQPKDKDDAPSEIVADKDCVISFIAVSRGRAAVQKGMAVKKGDTVITGDLSSEKEGYMVRADGMVLGEVSYVSSATALRRVVKKVRTGEKGVLLALRIFGREFTLNAPFEDYELEPLREYEFDASPFPIRLREYVCCELKAMPVTDTDEDAGQRAKLMAQEKLFKLIPHDAGITAINSSTTINADGSVTAVMTVITVERIGSRREY